MSGWADVIAWPRFLAVFVAGTVATALIAGVPTDVIPNGWFTRMTPVAPYDVPILVAVAVLSGLLMATNWGLRNLSCPTRGASGAGATGATFGWLAIGCPVCNKLVIAALGTSGALSYFAPVQPFLATLSIALLVGALAWRGAQIRASARRETVDRELAAGF